MQNEISGCAFDAPHLFPHEYRFNSRSLRGMRLIELDRDCVFHF